MSDVLVPKERTPYPVHSDHPAREVDLKEVWRAIVRRRFWVLGSVLAMLCLAIAYLLIVKREYTAHAVVVMDVRETRIIEDDPVVSLGRPDMPLVSSEVDTIASPASIRKVVDELSLVKDPEFNAELDPDPPLHSVLIGKAVDSLKSLVTGAGADKNLFTGMTPHQKVMEAVGQRLGVYNNNKSYTIQISFRSESPDKAALIANAFADNYVRAQRDAKLEATDRASQWLEKRLTELGAQVRDKEQAVRDFQERERLIETGGSTIILRQLAELSSQLVLARADIADAEARLRTARDLVRSNGSIDNSADVMASPLIQSLREQETQLRAREGELAPRIGPLHPETQQIKAKLGELRRKMAEEVRRVAEGLDNRARSARLREQALMREITALEEKAAVGMHAGVQLEQLRREADATRQLYESFLKRSKEIGEQAELQRADAVVTSPAMPPSKPSFPKKMLVLSAAGVIGMAIGLMLAFVREKLESGFRRTDEVERQLGYPVVGVIPNLRRRKGPPEDQVLGDPRSPFGDALRSLGAGIGLIAGEQPPRVLLVTSAVPMEGKTTLCLSLARLLARTNNRVLIIDADLHRPRVNRAVGGRSDCNLMDVLNGRALLAEAVQEDPKSGAHYIAASSMSEDPLDLLASPQMRGLLDAAAAYYDFIIVDTPPVMAVTDATVLSRYADGCIFLVAWANTPREVAEAGIRRLAQGGARILGAVLTQVDLAQYGRYGAGGYASYGQQYRSYFGR